MARGEWKETTELIKAAVEILEVENPMTVRQLFYRLVSTGALENKKKDYQLTSKVMTKARQDGRCLYEWIVDRSRPTYEPNVFEDAADYAETVKHSYRKNYWADQPNHVEVWAEKDAIIGSIEPVTDELGVTVRVGRGYFSTTRIKDIANHFERIHARGKTIFVLYLGDHDPSGQNMQQEGGERLTDLLSIRFGRYAKAVFDLERIAILKRDVSLFNLSPLRIKDSDSRSHQFLKHHGPDCVELDALPPAELRSRLRAAIEDLIDKELWDRAVAIEEVELNNIKETVGKWFPATD